MTRVEIASERESGNGWTFEAVVHAGGDRRSLEVRLSWADYNLWSHDGGDPPEEVARAAVTFLSAQPTQAVRDSFDAAVLRRHYADADERIPELICRP